LSSPLLFQRAVAICSKFTRRGSLLAFSLLTCWVSTKSLIQSLRTLRKCWRIESPVPIGADGGRKFDVKDVSWTSEIVSDQRRLLLKAHSLAVRLFPTIGFSDAGINALQDHRPSSFVHPCKYPCSRRAAGSRVVRTSHHRWLLRKSQLSQPWPWEKTRGIWEP
jgi:hypothetical protein